MADELHLLRRTDPVGQVRGFSLLELLVVMALALSLAALALPTWRGLLERWMLRSQGQALVDDLRWARTQAIARAQPVSLCLALEAGVCAAAGQVASGWLVFLDPDGDRLLDPGETVLRQHQGDAGGLSIGSNASRAVLTYQSTGLARGAAQTLTLGAGSAGAQQRLICVSMQGRAALQAEGSTSCS